MIRLLILFIIINFKLLSQNTTFEFENFWSIFEIQDVYTLNYLPEYIGEINYEVEAYKVTYLTKNEDDSLVNASGVIYKPVNSSCVSPILSWQHGTIVADFSAPSQKINNNIIGLVAASHGYVVVMSDYLGLGEGYGFHNYCHSDTESSAVINLILETIEFISPQNFNGQLFLMGYSQGGHATMAAVKEIESNFTDVINITASCPMAGPYSMSSAQAEMLNEVYPNPGYFPYVIFSYQNVYGNLYENSSQLFKAGFENLLEMYDGTYSMSEINDEIWSIAENVYGISQSDFSPLDMINNNYYQDYLSDEEHPFKLALKDNDLVDFTPDSPMRLIHCNGDDNVPYENSLLAFNYFSQFTSEELVLLDGGNFNHSDCAQPSIIAAKLFFDQLVEFCNNTSINTVSQNKYIVKYYDIYGRVINKYNESSNLFIKLYSDGTLEKSITF